MLSERQQKKDIQIPGTAGSELFLNLLFRVFCNTQRIFVGKRFCWGYLADMRGRIFFQPIRMIKHSAHTTKVIPTQAMDEKGAKSANAETSW